MSSVRTAIHIGTSGWSYEHWKGPFYPADLANERMLDYYVEHLRSVEVNSSFYHLPQKDMLRQWRKAVPEDFVFTIKASRYITHMKKLKDAAESVRTFLERITVLGDKLGPSCFSCPRIGISTASDWRPFSARYPMSSAMPSSFVTGAGSMMRSTNCLHGTEWRFVSMTWMASFPRR